MKSIISKNTSNKTTITTFTYVATIVTFLLWFSLIVCAAWGGDEELFMYRYLRASIVALVIIGVLTISNTIFVCICRHFTNEPISRSNKTTLVICSITGVFAIFCTLMFYNDAQNEYAKIQSRQVKTEQITETVFDDKYGIVIDGIEFDATEAAYLIDKDYINIDNYEIAVDDTSKQVIFSESN